MRMAEEKVCKLKRQQKALYRKLRGRLGERVVSLLLGWLVAAFREKKQFLLSVCHFAVKLLQTRPPDPGRVMGLAWHHLGFEPLSLPMNFGKPLDLSL